MRRAPARSWAVRVASRCAGQGRCQHREATRAGPRLSPLLISWYDLLEGARWAGSGAHRWSRPNDRLAECPERGADLVGEQLRLFPRREVPALLDLVEVD